MVPLPVTFPLQYWDVTGSERAEYSALSVVLKERGRVRVSVSLIEIIDLSTECIPTHSTKRISEFRGVMSYQNEKTDFQRCDVLSE